MGGSRRGLLTVLRQDWHGIGDEEIRKGAMNVSADFLARLGRAKDADDGDWRFFCEIRGLDAFAQTGIVSGRRGLVVVDAVEPDPEGVHGAPSSCC
jgi:hypothetical protein